MTRFIMMVGVPGSGKSTIAKELSKKYNAKIHSSDSIRKELFGDENCQDNPARVFKTLHYRIRNDLEAGHSVIMDATNVDRKSRKSALKNISHIQDVEKIAVVIRTDLGECMIRDSLRDRVAGKEVIQRMADKFKMPSEDEGFDRIEIIRN